VFATTAHFADLFAKLANAWCASVLSVATVFTVTSGFAFWTHWSAFAVFTVADFKFVTTFSFFAFTKTHLFYLHCLGQSMSYVMVFTET